jgi:prephenate dehydrogenase
MWEAVGAVPRETEAAVHDRLMLKVSHVPQVTANALATLLAEAGVGQAQLGPGARDMTRLAASSPEMWMDLFRLAGAELPRTVRALGAELERLASTLDRGDMHEMEAIMRRTQAWRRAE